MKVLIKFSANISSWSNKGVAEFLNKVINPKDANSKITKLDENQIELIKNKLGSAPKLPALFKEIYQQFKHVDLSANPTPKEDKPAPAPKPKPKRWGSGEILNAGRMALKICRELLGPDNAALCTRILDDDGQVDIDLGKGVAKYPINSSRFYDNYSKYREYDSIRVARIIICSRYLEIEGNLGNYERELTNPAMVIPCIKKHLKDCVSLNY